MDEIPQDQAQSFDAVAALYDAHRPGYPQALFDDLMAAAALEPQDAILELGCGSGQATQSLAPYGRPILALDPGGSLIEAAQRRLAGAPHVHFEVSTFEAWQAPSRAFGLVVSAQAFHWIDPAVGFGKTAQVLAPGGLLAVFGHLPEPAPEPLAAILQAHLPTDVRHDPPEGWYWPDAGYAQALAISGLFGPATHTAYPHGRTYDGPGLANYLRTRSDFRALGAERLEGLLDEVAAAVEGTLEVRWQTHLHLARRL